MNFYTANYSTTNHNFVIQNLIGKRVESKYLPAILILKNILQRGKPTLMSKFLQNEIGSIQKNEDFKKPFVLIDKELPKWNHTIKGNDNENDYPAKVFFEKIIPKELKEYEFITQLIRPETPINEITQRNDEQFENQQVDFYLPQAFLVIEIDGQQHKTEDHVRIGDTIRDNHLVKHRIKTIRIDTKDIRNNTPILKNKIDEIRNRLEEAGFIKTLAFYQKNYSLDFNTLSKEVISEKLLPTAIIRFQILLLELLEVGKLSFDSKNWNIEIKEHDIKGFASLAIEDLLIWFEYLFKLQKIDFKKPNYEITAFTKKNNIKIDFSLLKRWTDENELNSDIIYVRTDYFDIYYDIITKKSERINNFRLSSTKPVVYTLRNDDKNNDIENLEFFVENIFGHPSFNTGQYSIIENALARRDTIGLLPTGGGKSLIYQLACLLQPSISFVVCPIKSLMFDQKVDLEDSYFQNVETITSEVIGAARKQILDNFGNGKYFFVFISPERFQTQDFRNRLLEINNSYSFAYAVIDEVHCLSEWGHDFRTSYLNISKTIQNYCGDFKFLGLTATASVNVLKDIQIEFNIKQEDVKTLIDYTRPELEFIVVKDNGNKYQTLRRILQDKNERENIFEIKDKDTKCGLIFTPNANIWFGALGVANDLKKDLGIDVRFYAGKKPDAFILPINCNTYDDYKNKVQNDFKDNKFSLLAATKAFGMGINKLNIDYTFHYGIPSSMESLYQEAGRAGRKKQASKCYILLSEEKEDQLKLAFEKEATYEELTDLQTKIGFNGQDVFRQLFLSLRGLEPIEQELDLIRNLHTIFSVSGSKNTVNGNKLGAEKARVEKAIYRLSNIGIIKDWTIENFFGGGVFTVYYEEYTENTIQDNLLNFIRKYEDNFDFDNKVEHQKYTEIYNRLDLNTFEKSILILLQWSYDKFAASRRKSLKNVYDISLAYEDTVKGKESYKQALEAYFKFTQATYILQHIAENNDKEFDKWFEVFYDENKDFIEHAKFIELEGNLRRFLESYQNNTGLNLINGLVSLHLDKSLVSNNLERFKNALQKIYNYAPSDYEYILEQIIDVAKHFNARSKIEILGYLLEIAKSEENRLALIKELGDSSDLLGYYNTKLKTITKTFSNGFSSIR